MGYFPEWNYNPHIGMTGPQKPLMLRMLDTVGDGTGDQIANGNYSDAGAGLTIFKFIPTPGTIVRIKHMIVTIVDGGPANGDNYGGGITLANGIEIWFHTVLGETDPVTNGLPIKKNMDWSRLGAHIELSDFQTGNNYVQAHWDTGLFGQDVRLRANEGDYLEIRLNDDFSGLVEHTFLVQGYYE